MIKIKSSWRILVFACLSMSIMGCTSGDVGNTSSGGTVSGVAAKGPLQVNSTVTAYKLNTDGTRSADTAATTVTDNLGAYNFDNIPWSGMTEIEAVGLYLNENTGVVSTTNAAVSAIINLPAVVPGVASRTETNPNIASTIAASVAKQTLATTPASNTATVDTLLQAANKKTAVALNLPTTLNGANIDLSTLNLIDTANANPALAAANQQLLTSSAELLDALSNGAAGGNVDTLVSSLVPDINAGSVLGTSSGITAVLQASQATVATNASTIAQNITAAITTANAVPGATPIIVDANLGANLATAAASTNLTWGAAKWDSGVKWK